MIDPYESAIVGVVGAGVVGQAIGRVLRQRSVRTAWFDTDAQRSRMAAKRFGGVTLDSMDDLDAVDVVVLATPSRQAHEAAGLLAAGRDVVCLSDDPADVRALIDLDHLAVELGLRLVVGAALSPGLSGLLARHLVEQLAVVDEIHVATHGTAGPSCARQHHDALGSRGLGWHDGAWVERPGGSGRELVWFPEPIGPHDCYRGALADPLLLHRAFPGADRISARVSARRRDRLTARLPLLVPPRKSGDRGALRVEVRGALATGERITHVVGAVGRTGDLAGTVAALFAEACVSGVASPGVVVAGTDVHLSRWVLAGAADCGLLLQEYTGITTVSGQ